MLHVLVSQGMKKGKEKQGRIPTVNLVMRFYSTRCLVEKRQWCLEELSSREEVTMV
jgi:hypothetical protein